MNQSLFEETLEQYAVDYFEQIPDRGETAPDRYPQTHSAYENVPLNKILRIVPPNPSNVLSIMFTFAPLRENYSCDPVQFLKFILSYEGQGSLYRYVMV